MTLSSGRELVGWLHPSNTTTTVLIREPQGISLDIKEGWKAMKPSSRACSGRGISVFVAIILVCMFLSPSGTSLSHHVAPGDDGFSEGNCDHNPEFGRSSPSDGIDVRGFTENMGQLIGDFMFYASSDRGAVLFNEGGLTMVLEEGPKGPTVEGATGYASRTVLDITFVGAQPSAPRASDPLPFLSNYLLGDDPDSWVTGARTFGRVVYSDLWEDIDIEYRIHEGRLKYDILVRPGGDPSDVRLGLNGQNSISTLADGSLAIGTTTGQVLELPPVAFVEPESDKTVECRFVIHDEGTYGFDVGDYDEGATLVIDPLVNSTFLGGSDIEDIGSVALDNNGNVLVTGYTRSLDLPLTDDAIDNMTGGSCAYVSKLDANLTQLQYSTYIGGSEWDYGRAVGADPDGSIYVAGCTMSYDFPTTDGAFQTVHAGSWDVFVCKLDADGTRFEYSTLLGGSRKDNPSYLPDVAMHVDDAGAAYVAGSTESDDFPTTNGAFQNARVGGEDAYLAKIHPLGGSLEYSTFIGGSGNEYCFDLAVSSGGEAYFCGQTSSLDLPTTTGSYQENHTGDYSDMFVGALSSDGSSLEYLTHVGGWSSEEAVSLALDAKGALYVHGTVLGTDFPTTTDAYQENAPGGGGDPVLFKLSPKGDAIEYATFVGGSGYDLAGYITVDQLGNVYLTGWTSSNDFPTTADCDQDTFRGGGYDCYVSAISPDGDDLLFSTYLGMNQLDVSYGLVFDGNASLYVCGFTQSGNFPMTTGAYQPTFGGGNGDGFVVRYVIDVAMPIANAGEDFVIDQHETVSFNGTGSWDNLGIVDFTWRFIYDGAEVTLGGMRPKFTFHTVGIYIVNLTVTDPAGNTAWDLVMVTVRDITPPLADAGQNVTVIQYQTVMFDGKGSTDNVGVHKWTWTFIYANTPATLHGPTPLFTFQDAGVYVVQLNVTDEAGNWATAEMTVRVRDVTAPVADAGRDLRIDQHKTVTFDGTRSHDNVGITNWTWSLEYEGVNVTLYGPSPNFTFNEPGLYTMSLKVADGEGNSDTDSILVEVIDIERPNAMAGEDLTLDQDHTVVFDGTGSWDNVGIATFEWSFEYDNITIKLDGVSPNFFFHTAGVYTVMLVVTDDAGNWASDFVVVTVLDITVPIADAGLDVTVDQHQVVSFDGSGSWDNSGIVRWTWEFSYKGTNFTLGGATPSFLFDEAGTFEVVLTVADPFDNEDSDVLTVTVSDTTPPVADPGEDVDVPQGVAVELNATLSHDNVGIEEWEWTLSYQGMDVSIKGEVQQFTFEVPGMYEVKLNVVDGAGNNGFGTLSVTVRDTTPPVAIGPGHMTVDLGKRRTLDGSSSTDNVGIVQYIWTISYEDSTYEEVLLGSIVEYTFDRSGRYEVSLTIEDAEGNSDTVELTVTVEGGFSTLWILVIIIVVVVVAAVLFVMWKERRASLDR